MINSRKHIIILTGIKIVPLLFFSLIFSISVNAQRFMEPLGRGGIAVRQSPDNVFVSWRILGNEFDNNTTYNLYRDDTKIASNLTISNYVDNIATNGTYQVAAVVNETELRRSPDISVNDKIYYEIPLKQDVGDCYVHLAWAGDLDGDGEFEFVVDRIPNIDGLTCKVEAYKTDGTRLWQVDMGPLSLNRDGIEGGAAAISNGMWDGVTVYDLDCDGKSEVILKSANGTVFGNGGTLNYSDDIHNFVSVLNGETGAESARSLLPDDYFADGPLQTQFNIAYLNGITPSVVIKAKNRIGSGDFNLLIVAYQYSNNQLSEQWKWERGSRNCPDFHQQRIADVDLDGKDEIIDGGYVLDDDGSLLYTLGDQGIIHGDRFHIGDFDPGHKGLEGYGIQQDNKNGLAWYYFDAADGTLLQTQYLSSIGDYARGNVADLDPDHSGYEMWTFTDGIYNVNDGKVTDVIPTSYPNLRLWWNGDLLSEMLDGEKFNKWDYSGKREVRLLTASDYGAESTWRNVPVLYGDLFGDWREEVVYEKSDHSRLLIFTTTDPTDQRIYTLLHNPEYRLCLTTKGYYQSAQLDFYLGTDMATPPIPAMQQAHAVWTGDESITWNTTTNNWLVNGGANAYSSGDSVMFDLRSMRTEIEIQESISPANIYIISPLDYSFSGAGEITGNSGLVKSGYGSLTIELNTTYTGITKIEQGAVYVNASLENSGMVVYGGAKLGGKGIIGETCLFEKRSVLMPGQKDSVGTITFNKALVLPTGMLCEFGYSPNTGSDVTFDKIEVQGNLTIENDVLFDFSGDQAFLSDGYYPLISHLGSFTGDLGKVITSGITGKKFDLVDSVNTIWLRIHPSRNINTITWEGSGASWDLQNTDNWLLTGQKTTFTANDTVIFDQTGLANASVLLEGELPIGRMEVNGDNISYMFTGDGIISGNGDLIKTGSGSLVMEASSNTYTGKTIINNGSFTVSTLALAGQASSIGANNSTDPEEFVLNSAKLVFQSSSDSYTNKGLTLSGIADTICINNSGTTLSVNGVIDGTGNLVKTGKGILYLLHNNNSYQGGTIIEEGTIQLNDPGDGLNIQALGNGMVTFKGGALSMGNTSSYTEFTANFEVPASFIGTIYADQRCNYSGSLTGEGTLNIVLPGSIDRTIFRGNWSDFSGVLNISGVGPMRLASPSGYAKARFYLNDNISMYYSTGTSSGDKVAQDVHIGSLSGSPTSMLNGENWIIGETNDSTVFYGVISGNSVTKVGNGLLKLTNANTYTGNTNVNKGTLEIANTSGSATGTGTVNVNNGGKLTGAAVISGVVNIEAGGILSPGNSNTGNKLSLGSQLNLKTGSLLSVKTNTLFKVSDKVECEGKINVSGELEMINTTATGYSIDDEFKIFDCDNIEGAFTSIKPESPGNDLIWDVSELTTRGVIKVKAANMVSVVNSGMINVYPNPVSDILYIRTGDGEEASGQVLILDINGKIIKSEIIKPDNFNSIDIGYLPGGIYTVHIEKQDQCAHVKIVKV